MRDNFDSHSNFLKHFRGKINFMSKQGIVPLCEGIHGLDQEFHSLVLSSRTHIQLNTQRSSTPTRGKESSLSRERSPLTPLISLRCVGGNTLPHPTKKTLKQHMELPLLRPQVQKNVPCNE